MQQYFRDEMTRHGYPDKTFKFEFKFETDHQTDMENPTRLV